MSNPESEPAARFNRWILFGFFLCLSVVAFFPALHGEFVSDDAGLIQNNPQLRSWDGLVQIWKGVSNPDYWPITYTAYWIEYRLFGEYTLAYHLVNALLQGVAGFLLYRLLKQLTIPAAWLIAGIFTVHPIQVETVAWIVELKNILAALFFFLSISFYLESEERTSRVRYTLSLFCFALSVFSKASTVALPLVLLLIAWWQRKPIDRKRISRVAPFFAIAAVAALSTLYFQREMAGATGKAWSNGLDERVMIAAMSFWFYIGKIFCPASLSFSYSRWEDPWHSWQSFAAVGFLIAAAAYLHLKRDSWGKHVGFALAFFILLLLPVLGFFDMYFAMFAQVADRWQYLAMIGPVALFTAALVPFLNEKFSSKSELVFGSVLLVICIALSWNHAKSFQCNQTLFQTTLEKNPNSPLAQAGLGMDYYERKTNLAEAERLLREAVAGAPDYERAQHGLALILRDSGKGDEAKKIWEKLLKKHPFLGVAHAGLGELYLKEKNYTDAIPQFEMALRNNPFSSAWRTQLAEAIWKSGDTESAKREFWIAQRQDPDNPQSYLRLGELLLEQDQKGLARQQFDRAKFILQKRGEKEKLQEIEKKLSELK